MSIVCRITDDLIRKQSGVTDISSLRSLDLHLRDSKLGKIKIIENLETLNRLQKLNLSYNAINIIQGLNNLPLLELNLAENNISSLDGIEFIMTLERLNVSGNEISRIPRSIVNLQSLTIMRISRNKLGVIEDVSYLGDINTLTNITLDDNPITNMIEDNNPNNNITRSYTIFRVPSLRAVSSKPISEHERMEVQRLFTSGAGFNQLALAQENIADQLIRSLRRGNLIEESALQRSSNNNMNKINVNMSPIERERERRDNNRGEQGNVSAISALTVSPQTTKNNNMIETLPPPTTTTRITGEKESEEMLELSGRLDNLATRLMNTQASRDRRNQSQQLEAARQELRSALREGEHPNLTASSYNVSSGRNDRRAVGFTLTGQSSSSPSYVDRERDGTNVTNMSPLLYDPVSSNIITASGTRSSHVPFTTTAVKELESDILRKELEESRDEERNVRAISHRYADELDTALKALEDEKRKNRQMRRDLEASRAECDILRNREADFREQLIEANKMTKDSAVLSQRLGLVSNERDKSENALEATQAEVVTLKRLLDDATSSLDRKDHDLENLRESLQGKEDMIKEIDRELQETRNVATRAKSESSKAISDLENSEKERKEATRQVALLTARLGSMQRDMDAYLNAANKGDIYLALKKQQGNRVASSNRFMYNNTTSSGNNGGNGSSGIEEENEFIQTNISNNNNNNDEHENIEDIPAFTIGTEGIATTLNRHSLAQPSSQPQLGQPGQQSYYQPSGLPHSNYLDDEIEKEKENFGQMEGLILETSTEADASFERNADRLGHIRTHSQTTGALKSLETAAVEAVAFVLYKELNNADLTALRNERRIVNTAVRRADNRAKRGIGQDPLALAPGVSSSPDGVEEIISQSTVGKACATAALRLIRTAINKARTAGSDSINASFDTTNKKTSGAISSDDIILPLSVLGDRAVLADMIADAQSALMALNMAESAREENLHLSKVIAELEATETMLLQEIGTKEDALHKVNEDVVMAEERAHDVVTYLEELANTLNEKRDALSDLETQMAVTKKEVEINRRDLEETKSLVELEQSSLQSTKEKLRILRQEASSCEAAVAKAKHTVSEQDARARASKAAAEEHTRTLQAENGRLSNEIVGRQAEVAELERYKRYLEDEGEERRKTLDSQMRQLETDIEETTRALAGLRSDSRTSRMEVDALLNKKRTTQVELTRLTDSLHALETKFEIENENKKRQLESVTQHCEEAEKRESMLRNRIGHSESQVTNLKREIDDLTRAHVDLQRSLETKKRTIEAEIDTAHNQTTIAMKNARQAASEAEDKRNDLEVLAATVRNADRKAEEHKRMMRELEDLIMVARTEAKTAAAERDRVNKELSHVKKELEVNSSQLVGVRAQLETDNKTCDELKRKLVTMNEEESDLLSRDDSIKKSYNDLRSKIDEMTRHLDDVRLQMERDKRSMLDIKSKKTTFESDLTRIMDEVKFQKNLCDLESKRAEECSMTTTKAREELGRVNVELVAARSKLQESKARETELLRREKDIQETQARLRTEALSISTALECERKALDDVKSEIVTFGQQLKTIKHDIKLAEKEQQSALLALEQTRSHQAHNADVSASADQELHRIQSRIKEETSTLSRLENNVIDTARRLKDVKSEVIRAEERCDRLNALGADEDRKLEQRKRAIIDASNELINIEQRIKLTSSNLEKDRDKAVKDIIELGATKNAVQSRLLSIADAQRRLGGDLLAPSIPGIDLDRTLNMNNNVITNRSDNRSENSVKNSSNSSNKVYGIGDSAVTIIESYEPPLSSTTNTTTTTTGRQQKSNFDITADDATNYSTSGVLSMTTTMPITNETIGTAAAVSSSTGITGTTVTGISALREEVEKLKGHSKSIIDSL